MNETLFKHQEKKWTPINKQASLIIRKASALLLHTPPIPNSVKAPTLAERLSAESKIRLASIAARETANNERLKARAERKAAQVKSAKPKTWRNMWAARHLKMMHKSRGLPPPSQDEVRAFRMAQPNYGKIL